MISKPSFINRLDFEELRKKYPNDIKLKEIIKKIENNYPIQYAIGNVNFLGNEILVNEDVLVPRFETELLVDTLSKYISKYNFDKTACIDVCTGSGCIAVALKKKFSDLEVWAIDVSEKALSVAKSNSTLNEVNINFLCLDVLHDFNLSDKFDVLVSNPPYVKKGELVSPNTKYEPQIALYPGDDDIIFYRKILEKSVELLHDKNIIAFEIGSTQASRICDEARKYYPKSDIKVVKDYNQFDRFIFIFNNCE